MVSCITSAKAGAGFAHRGNAGGMWQSVDVIEAKVQ